MKVNFHTSDIARVWANVYAAELTRHASPLDATSQTRIENFKNAHLDAEAAANEAAHRFIACFQLTTDPQPPSR